MQAASIARPRIDSGVARWALIGIALYVVAGVATLFAIAWLGSLVLSFGIDAGAGTVGLSIRNGIQAIVWGLAAAAIAAPIGRRLVPEIRFERRGLLVLAIGLVLAGLTTFALDEWARERYAQFDPEYVGWAVFAAPAIVAVSVAAWAALSVPRAARGALLLLLAAAGLGLALAVLPSVPGLANGLDARSAALATILVADGAFIAFAMAIARR